MSNYDYIKSIKSKKKDELFYYNNHKFHYDYSVPVVDDDRSHRNDMVGYIHVYVCITCDLYADIHADLGGKIIGRVFKYPEKYTCNEWKFKNLLR